MTLRVLIKMHECLQSYCVVMIYPLGLDNGIQFTPLRPPSMDYSSLYNGQIVWS